MFTDVGHELEDAQSEPDPLIQHNAKVPTTKEARTARAQFLALCWSLFMIGWTDGSTGPLLPRIQKFYDVGFGTVSCIFILQATGSIVGALLNMPLSDRLGLGRMLVFGPLFQIAAFLIASFQFPFPFFALSFTLCGIGMVFQDTSANGFIASLQKDSEYKMGFIHAAYGIGALAAPLSSTYFAQSTTHWSHHYLISTALSVWNLVILAVVFRFQSQDACLQQAGEILPEIITSEETHENKFSQLMKNKTVHLLGAFLMIYIGVEVTMGGWIVTLLIIVRGGGPLTGYVSTGFFGGLTLGRVILVELDLMSDAQIGVINAIYIYIFLAIVLQLIVWLVPSFTTAAISVSIIGILLGPIYPIVMNHTTRVLPSHLVNGTIGWITACGASGSAFLPFLTGMMASDLGIRSLQPLLLVMMTTLFVLWIFVPKIREITDSPSVYSQSVYHPLSTFSN